MSPDDARLLVAAGAGLGVDVGPDTLARLTKFLHLLDTWNRRIRLTGERDPRTLVRKHVVDSLAPVPLLPARGPVLDIGAGGGFPGIVLGCCRPDLALVLVEPRRRPRSFLAEAAREIPLPNTRAVEARGEDLVSETSVAGKVTLAIARALRLELFLALAAPLLAPDGVAVAMQTPRTTPAAASTAAAAVGLALRESREYELPDGDARRLLLFQRRA